MDKNFDWFYENCMRPNPVSDENIWSASLHRQALDIKVLAIDREIRSIKVKRLGLDDIALRAHQVARAWLRMSKLIMEMSKELEK
jgi:hypothetical protein